MCRGIQYIPIQTSLALFFAHCESYGIIMTEKERIPMLLQGVAFTLGYLLLPLWLVKKGTQCKCEQAVPKLCFPLLTYSI